MNRSCTTEARLGEFGLNSTVLFAFLSTSLPERDDVSLSGSQGLLSLPLVSRLTF
jgi:hypothetical protein